MVLAWERRARHLHRQHEMFGKPDGFVAELLCRRQAASRNMLGCIRPKATPEPHRTEDLIALKVTGYDVRRRSHETPVGTLL